eukprot:CAMPEP_0194034458 /NCGR_PEP_ID=MMETSP0009_2-20130614/6881_1 /TAXON_ID=210454 /ORGANISM="Grammatophora oceanica, Strain CCMP 410" /LENGTH=79 /DNA_ID=CAMNT_0038675399 /DNA_START=57 /DNA_END=292 /DNA_ORIENTATION=-
MQLGSFGGAAIRNFGSMTIKNSTFFNIQAAGNGGAIYHAGKYGGAMAIESSVFSGNQAPRGGAIYNSAGAMAIESSTFS